VIKHVLHTPYLIILWMNLWGFKGLATPWYKIYYIDAKSFMNGRLRKHEEMHIRQMRRDGVILYMIKYNWFWMTVGYKNNPYEIEARKAEDEV